APTATPRATPARVGRTRTRWATAGRLWGLMLTRWAIRPVAGRTRTPIRILPLRVDIPIPRTRRGPQIPPTLSSDSSSGSRGGTRDDADANTTPRGSFPEWARPRLHRGL